MPYVPIQRQGATALDSLLAGTSLTIVESLSIVSPLGREFAWKCSACDQRGFMSPIDPVYDLAAAHRHTKESIAAKKKAHRKKLLRARRFRFK